MARARVSSCASVGMLRWFTWSIGQWMGGPAMVSTGRWGYGSGGRLMGSGCSMGLWGRSNMLAEGGM